MYTLYANNKQLANYLPVWQLSRFSKIQSHIGRVGKRIKMIYSGMIQHWIKVLCILSQVLIQWLWHQIGDMDGSEYLLFDALWETHCLSHDFRGSAIFPLEKQTNLLSLANGLCMGSAWVYMYGGYYYIAGAIKRNWPFVKLLVGFPRSTHNLLLI